MNGNDYIEIEEAHIEQIHEDYCKEKCLDSDTFNYENIPDDWKFDWISRYLEG
jgi:hypothetical protein